MIDWKNILIKWLIERIYWLNDWWKAIYKNVINWSILLLLTLIIHVISKLCFGRIVTITGFTYKWLSFVLIAILHFLKFSLSYDYIFLLIRWIRYVFGSGFLGCDIRFFVYYIFLLWTDHTHECICIIWWIFRHNLFLLFFLFLLSILNWFWLLYLFLLLRNFFYFVSFLILFFPISLLFINLRLICYLFSLLFLLISLLFFLLWFLNNSIFLSLLFLFFLFL